MKKIIVIFLALLPMVGVRAQIVDDEGLYVDTVFHDHINRQAEDFVKAYVCIAEPTDWRDDFLGVNGHAFIRLVCDTFGMDYCFSYESESVEGQMDKYMQGKLKMGMFAIPTEEYLVDYQKWNRAVHQYKLNLPPDVEQRLWEIMDNRVMEGDQLKMDMNKRGCSVSAVRFIVRSLGDLKIEYPEDLPYKNMTLREIQYQAMGNWPWMRLAYDTWADNVFNRSCDIEGKMIIPKDVAVIWQQSTLLGKPILEYDQDIVAAPAVEVQKPLVTPLYLAWILVLLTLVFVLIRYKMPTSRVFTYWMWLWLVALVIASMGFVYLFLITRILPTSSLILILLFNILPLVCWKWRKVWQIPYSSVLLLGIVALWMWPHMVVDPFYLVVALNYMILYSANWLLDRRDERIAK